jgi:hypothetical protein
VFFSGQNIGFRKIFGGSGKNEVGRFPKWLGFFQKARVFFGILRKNRNEENRG